VLKIIDAQFIVASFEIEKAARCWIHSPLPFQFLIGIGYTPLDF